LWRVIDQELDDPLGVRLPSRPARGGDRGAQRLARHEHPEAVADALRAVPRSRPFHDLPALERIGCPAVVVASREEADPSHPLALGEGYAELLPAATLVVEPRGRGARRVVR